MEITIYQVDSFTNKPFAGNPAGVCLLSQAADEKWMQNVASEMNLAETAFLYREPDGAYHLRWFTPTIEVESEDLVRNLQPNHFMLSKLPVRGVIVTSRITLSKNYDFVSRFFAPGSGVAEDSVTGSSHCCLAPYWAEKLGKSEMIGYQASARGGIVRVRLKKDRVILGGQAVTVLHGTLLCSA
jgi:predicted PhzF superfamily epimerase YddE/YHI9